MPLRRPLAAVLVIAVSTVGAAHAQQPVALATTELRADDTVKVWSRSPRLRGKEGTLTQLPGDTLFLTAPAGFRRRLAVTAVPTDAITRVDVLRGRDRSVLRMVAGAVTGAVAGGAVAVAMGAVVGPFVYCKPVCTNSDNGWDTRTMASFMGAAAAAPYGLTIGFVAGGIGGAQRRPRWERVYER